MCVAAVYNLALLITQTLETSIKPLIKQYKKEKKKENRNQAIGLTTWNWSVTYIITRHMLKKGEEKNLTNGCTK